MRCVLCHIHYTVGSVNRINGNINNHDSAQCQNWTILIVTVLDCDIETNHMLHWVLLRVFDNNIKSIIIPSNCRLKAYGGSQVRLKCFL